LPPTTPAPSVQTVNVVQQFLALYTQELERQAEVDHGGRNTALFTPDPVDERRRTNATDLTGGDNGQSCVR
jgi:hypothetical protein